MAERKVGYFIYNTCLALATIVLTPIFLVLVILKHHLIAACFQINTINFPKPVIWIHTASDRQVAVADCLVQNLRAIVPDFQCLISVSGKLSIKHYQQLSREIPLILLPGCLGFYLKYLIFKLKPRALLVIETLSRPEIIRYCNIAGSKIALINGRVDKRSLMLFKMIPGFIKEIFGQIHLFAMQSVADANLIGELGAPLHMIKVTGDIGFKVFPKNKVFDRALYAEFSDRDSVEYTIRAISSILGGTFEKKA